MQSLQKFRRYELSFIILAVSLYVTRRLFQLAAEFNYDVTLAERAIKQGAAPTKVLPSLNVLWQDLFTYNHNLNTILPTILGAILLLMAWYAFHYQVFPRWKNIKTDSKLFLLFLILTIIWSLASVYVYDSLKLYWRFRYDNAGNIIGFKVYSLFRQLYIITDTIAVLAILLLYEAFAQLYYFIHAKLKEEKEDNFQYLDYFLVASIVLFILLTAIFGNLPRKNYWYGAIRELSLWGIALLTIYQAQNTFYKNVLPYFSNLRSKEFSFGLSIFFILCAVGSLLTYFIQFISWTTYSSINFGFHFEWVFVMFAAFTLSSIFIAFLRKVFSKEKIQLRTLFTQKSAELSTLRSQINPHFLFNALNTLYSVSLKENAEKTAEGIQKLGDMMRFMLHENHQDRIPLSKEVEYLQNFIEIQRMRLDESHDIEIKVNIQPTERDIFIAPMLLNPFVENAFKHGISFRNKSWIFITLTHDAQKLYFKVHNSLHPKADIGLNAESLEAENNGIGLENVKKRLDLIYPNRHTLDIQVSDNDYFISLVLGIY